MSDARKLQQLMLAAAVAVFVSGSAALADANFDQGVRLYSQGNYRAAAAYFDRAVSSSNGDSSVLYYAGLTYHRLGDYARAKAIYHQILATAPSSQAAQLAAAALRQIEPGFRSSGSSGTTATSSNSGNAGVSTSSSSDTLPNESRVYFTKHGNELLVNAELNNRAIKMYFDTGASVCLFGKNHLQQLGLNPPTGSPTSYGSGVGSAGAIPMWEMRCDLKLGQITRRNFPISVQENLTTEPLLGQTFYKEYEYTIDNGAESIAFKRKGQAPTAKTAYDVPFTKEGNEMVVVVEVNGRKCPMYFDTGASGITFSPAHLKSVGLAVPEDAQEAQGQGIGGLTKSLIFNVQKMRMGPIEKTDIPVSVVEKSAMGHPLLGQTFYGDWQYTIDNAQHVIRFVRR